MMHNWRTAITILFAWFACLLGSISLAQAEQMRLAVTTSFNNSGLSDILLPKAKEDLEIDVQLLVVGTGQALRLGRAGDVDAILVHSKTAEEKFVSEGFGVRRTEIMYNDFVLVGPSDDPAKLQNARSASDALVRIKKSEAAFVSRGDDSGTHKKELSLWNSASLSPSSFPSTWYRSVGAGMGAALNTAAGMNAYIMSDRASWLKFQNKQDLKLLFAGDPVLFNQYTFLLVNSEKHPHVKADLASKLEGWLTSETVQALIGAYTLGGEVLFTPNAFVVQSN